MILIKNANLISMEDINYEICDILIEGKVIKQIGKIYYFLMMPARFGMFREAKVVHCRFVQFLLMVILKARLQLREVIDLQPDKWAMF